jgi:hypothetical protein
MGLIDNLEWREVDLDHKHPSYATNFSKVGENNKILQVSALLTRDKLPFYECQINIIIHKLDGVRNNYVPHVDSSMTIIDLEKRGLDIMKKTCLNVMKNLIMTSNMIDLSLKIKCDYK